jgi:hypothetical protein
LPGGGGLDWCVCVRVADSIFVYIIVGILAQFGFDDGDVKIVNDKGTRPVGSGGRVGGLTEGARAVRPLVVSDFVDERRYPRAEVEVEESY